MKLIMSLLASYFCILAGVSGLHAGPALVCTASGSPSGSRIEGFTEPLSDYLISCTGGTPTPAGSHVPQVNLTLYLNTNATSHVTADPLGTLFTEALLLVDEPNSIQPSPFSPPSPKYPQRPLLNCGHMGAPDSGPNGPGICEIQSTGDPAATYDGTPCKDPKGPYGCGRPNVFQGRILTSNGEAANAISFVGVPLDPPGPNAQRKLRITNLRGNATTAPSCIEALALFAGMQMTLNNSQQCLSLPEPTIQSVTFPSAGKIRLSQFSNWNYRNLAMWVGNAAQGVPGNAIESGAYIYPQANYPDDVAQNVPNIPLDLHTEDMFQWQPPLIDGPPTPNPVPDLGNPVANIGHSLESGSYAPNTGISLAGVSTQGTRFALQFTPTSSTAHIACESTVYIRSQAFPGTFTGVLVMTATDGNGAGPFTRLTGLATSAPNLVVYEVLYSQNGFQQYVDIPCYNIGTAPAEAVLTVSLAPFYTSASAGRATPTPADPKPTAIPRFTTRPGGIKVTLPSHP